MNSRRKIIYYQARFTRTFKDFFFFFTRGKGTGDWEGGVGGLGKKGLLLAILEIEVFSKLQSTDLPNPAFCFSPFSERCVIKR